jgi:hypothetical protein
MEKLLSFENFIILKQDNNYLIGHLSIVKFYV